MGVFMDMETVNAFNIYYGNYDIEVREGDFGFIGGGVSRELRNGAGEVRTYSYIYGWVKR
jgi:hypothetical protein